MKLKPLHDNQEINDSVVQHPIITNLVNRDLSSLEKENFIMFPQQLNQSKDLSEDNLIFQSRNGKIWTCNSKHAEAYNVKRNLQASFD